MLKDLKKGGTFLLNCLWSDEEIDQMLPAKVKRDLAKKNINFYAIDAWKIAEDVGLGTRINMVMQAAFFKLTGVIPIEKAVEYLKEGIEKTYKKKGQNIVDMNCAAVDQGITAIRKIDIPESWIDVEDPREKYEELPEFIEDILIPMNRQEGDDLPVSAFDGIEDGTFPSGTAAYEKRGVAVYLPEWQPDKCIQCNQCSFVCPHAAIRPMLLDEAEKAAAPEGFVRRTAKAWKGCSTECSCLLWTAWAAETVRTSVLQRKRRSLWNLTLMLLKRQKTGSTVSRFPEKKSGSILIQLREVSSQNRISNSQVLVPDAVKLRISNW